MSETPCSHSPAPLPPRGATFAADDVAGGQTKAIKCTLGDLRVSGVTLGSGAVEVLPSLKVSGKAQSVRFVVDRGTEALASHNGRGDEDIVLCWVTHDGRLHRHYTYSEGSMDHDEGSFVGDSFVVFIAKRRTDGDVTEKPATAEKLAAGDAFRILFSYRLGRELDRRKKTHHIYFSLSDGSCEVTAAAKDDDEYRIEARLPKEAGPHRLPPCDEPWEVTYEFVCPPVPSSPRWDKRKQTFYVWGDMDFDDYGPRKGDGKQVHGCPMNQIVPQVMIGNCLASSDKKFKPSFEKFGAWVIQAQYFWQTAEGTSLALCGDLIRDVSPGDLLRTEIRYDCKDGSVRASIGVIGDDGKEDPKRRSEIASLRPFPHDPTLFLNWRDFFEKCQGADDEWDAASLPQKNRRLLRGQQGGDGAARGALGRPYLNVEYKGKVDVQTLKSICPFVVKKATYPGTAVDLTSQWQTAFFCPRFGRAAKLEDPKRHYMLELDEAIELDGKRGGMKE